MQHFEKILIPLDGSNCAEDVFAKVENLATDLKATLALLHACCLCSCFSRSRSK